MAAAIHEVREKLPPLHTFAAILYSLAVQDSNQRHIYIAKYFSLDASTTLSAYALGFGGGDKVSVISKGVSKMP